jgi:signal transduction histidine kinase
MKKTLSVLCVGLLCLLDCIANAQNATLSAKIISVKARGNQKGLVENIIVNPLKKQSFSLSYDQNYLQFHFVNAQDSARKSFTYLLKGLDYEWINCESCTRVQYAHLDGGDYTFLVKTNEPNAVPDEFSFTIEGNIWHEWWFVPMLFLYFLAIVGIGVYFFVLYQFRQKLKAQRLIHKEKMASLAELTSGIAHEIQNPLNFVTNFSQLSIELAHELKEEIDAPNADLDLVRDLTEDLIQNQQKINQHGQRASGIVKGMLEHSRSTAGERRLTDINALAEENLRRSFQNLQMKNKTVQVEYMTDFDKTLPSVKIIPQEIDRVLVNLVSNAFYAVQQKSALDSEPYQPTVWVTTKKVGNEVHISVRDNGMGMSETTKVKIFQPFFTTKPTGEGTGLGLSLTYDIVTKGHGGTIEVESAEGKGTEFIVKLPL